MIPPPTFLEHVYGVEEGVQEVVGDELSSFQMHAYGGVVARPLAG